jgi:hypothetical protein
VFPGGEGIDHGDWSVEMAGRGHDHRLHVGAIDQRAGVGEGRRDDGAISRAFLWNGA